jgi:ribosome maturation factor RimP
MASRNVVEIVTEIALPIVEGFGFELVDVEFVKEGSNRFLRIFIDKPGGITIDDCQAVSEKVSDRIDEADPIAQSYFLEV